MNIKDLIKGIVNERLPVQVVVGTVEAVDEENHVCEVSVDGKPTRYEVRIRAIIDGAKIGLLPIPKVKSLVLVGLIENRPESSFIALYTELTDLRLSVDNIELSGTEHGGLVISQVVADQVNELKEDLNTLKDVFKNWVPVPNDGGAKLKGDVTTWAAQPLDTTHAQDYENTNVKHGTNGK